LWLYQGSLATWLEGHPSNHSGGCAFPDPGFLVHEKAGLQHIKYGKSKPSQPPLIAMSGPYVLLEFGSDPFHTKFEDLEGRAAFTV
jgi:hypothetical protein